MKVIENFIPAAYQDKIESIFLSDNFSWYLLSGTVSPDYAGVRKDSVVERPQLTHMLNSYGNSNSQSWGLIEPMTFILADKLGVNVSNVFRVKANLNMQDSGYPSNAHFTPHVDCIDTERFTTAIYYVNDADGDTLFFDADLNVTHRITPKKGTLVCFDGNTLHAGQAPVVSPYRCVINFNFLGE